MPLSICSSYVQAGCFIGTDGDCTFALSVGATTGTKICRPKQCEDIADGKSNANGQGVIRGRECVSIGATCINKSCFNTYKPK